MGQVVSGKDAAMTVWDVTLIVLVCLVMLWLILKEWD